MTGLAFVSPWIIGFCVFQLLPICLAFYFSFTEYSVLESPLWIGLDNYAGLVRDPVFWKATANTGVFVVLVVALGTVLAIGIACLLNTNVWGRTVWRAMVFLPSLVPLVAAAMVWMWLYNGELGIINRTLDPVLGAVNALLRTDLRSPDWLGDPGWILVSLVIMTLWTLGNAMVIYLAALQDVPRSLYEAAAIDGVSRFGRFRHVTLPMISPVVLFNVITGLIAAWQVFAVPYIMLGPAGGPGRAGYFYTTYLYDNSLPYLRMGYASSMAWVQLVVILALTGLILWASKRVVHYQGGR